MKKIIKMLILLSSITSLFGYQIDPQSYSGLGLTGPIGAPIGINTLTIKGIEDSNINYYVYKDGQAISDPILANGKPVQFMSQWPVTGVFFNHIPGDMNAAFTSWNLLGYANPNGFVLSKNSQGKPTSMTIAPYCPTISGFQNMLKIFIASDATQDATGIADDIVFANKTNTLLNWFQFSKAKFFANIQKLIDHFKLPINSNAQINSILLDVSFNALSGKTSIDRMTIEYLNNPVYATNGGCSQWWNKNNLEKANPTGCVSMGEAGNATITISSDQINWLDAQLNNSILYSSTQPLPNYAPPTMPQQSCPSSDK